MQVTLDDTTGANYSNPYKSVTLKLKRERETACCMCSTTGIISRRSGYQTIGRTCGAPIRLTSAQATLNGQEGAGDLLVISSGNMSPIKTRLCVTAAGCAGCFRALEEYSTLFYTMKDSSLVY